MRYKRQEAFRYTFSKPIAGEIYCIEKEGQVISTRNIPITILDLSPNGLKIKTSENFLPSNTLQYSISFTLDGSLIQVVALPVWKVDQYDYFLYGFHMKQTEAKKQLIIHALKEHARNQLKQKR